MQTPHNKHLPYEMRPGHTNPESIVGGILFYIGVLGFIGALVYLIIR